jgi:hypothetical protein
LSGRRALDLDAEATSAVEEQQIELGTLVRQPELRLIRFASALSACSTAYPSHEAPLLGCARKVPLRSNSQQHVQQSAITHVDLWPIPSDRAGSAALQTLP